MTSQPSEPTVLYRYFDSAGHLLYVGITSRPDDRWKAHRSSPWARRAARRTEQRFGTRGEAEAAEVAAIRSEKPEFNGYHNFELAPFTGSGWPNLGGIRRGKALRLATLIREEIESGRWSRGQKIPSREAMAQAAGVSLTTAITAAELLQREGLIVLRRGHGLFVK